MVQVAAVKDDQSAIVTSGPGKFTGVNQEYLPPRTLGLGQGGALVLPETTSQTFPWRPPSPMYFGGKGSRRFIEPTREDRGGDGRSTKVRRGSSS